MKSQEPRLSAMEVHEIRNDANLTQSQFAEAVGVSKSTVARWESSRSACRGISAARIQRLAATASGVSNSSTTIFDVGRDELLSLDSTAAVEAFRDLLWCECRRLQLPSSKVQIGTREIADEGIDAVVSAQDNCFSAGSFLCSGANYFQIKAGTSWKPWQLSFAKTELLGKRNKLGNAVHRCLSDGGNYVLASFGTDLTPEQRQTAKSNIVGVFSECGFTDANVDVWVQQELIGLFGRFPFLSLRLLGRHGYRFLSWASWNMANEMSLALELGDAQQNFCEEIRYYVRNGETCHIRIIGEPGLGKTRLVHEALSDEDLSPLVVYVPHAEDFQRSQLFNDLLGADTDYFMILVLDECRPKDCAEIWDRLRNHSNRCTVVSVDHDSYQTGDQQFVQLECPRLADKHVAQIIDGYANGESDSRRWAELCSGVPRVAHAIGHNLQTNPDSLLQTPTMELIWDRFIAGYSSVESRDAKRKLTVLRYLALFYRFGFESPVMDEGEFIAELIEEDHPEITYARFQQVVTELKKQRILQGQTTLFIAPKLLHIHLWAQFWELHGRRRSIDSLLNRLPESLISWFVRMFPYAQESKVALEHVRRVLGPGGPFSNRKIALSATGCRFIHELSNAEPEYTLLCLENALEQTAADELSAFHIGRQDIVWALERIAMWPALFCRSAKLLRKLAESENETHSNNSTGVFIGLFRLTPGPGAPTGATPEIRLPILADTLDSSSFGTRKLGVNACKSAMSTYSGGRTVGPEHQGLKTVELWTPQTWGELYEALGNVWNLLFNASRNWENSHRAHANLVMIESAPELLQISSIADKVLDTLEILAQDVATDLETLVDQICWLQRFWKNELNERVVARLAAIDARITGTSFVERVRRIVLLSGRHEKFGSNTQDFDQRVAALAQEAIRRASGLSEVLPDLVKGTNNAVFEFGRKLSQLDDGANLKDIVEVYRNLVDQCSTLFISGYLASIFDSSPSTWEAIVGQLLDDVAFSEIVGPVIRNSGGTDTVILKMLERYDADMIPKSCLQAFRCAKCLKQLDESTLLAFASRIVAAGEIGMALELYDFIYCGNDSTRQMPQRETAELLSVFAFVNTRDRDIDFHWSSVVERYCAQFPSRQMELFGVILDKVAKSNWCLGHNPAYSQICSIIKFAPSECWQLLSSRIDAADGIERHRLIQWLAPPVRYDDNTLSGPLTLFPLEAVFEWIALAPSQRANDVAKVVPKTLSPDSSGRWARELLDRYGDYENVRQGLLGHFWSGGWIRKTQRSVSKVAREGSIMARRRNVD